MNPPEAVFRSCLTLRLERGDTEDVVSNRELLDVQRCPARMELRVRCEGVHANMEFAGTARFWSTGTARLQACVKAVGKGALAPEA